jgi:hypothetical protein
LIQNGFKAKLTNIIENQKENQKGENGGKGTVPEELNIL